MHKLLLPLFRQKLTICLLWLIAPALLAAAPDPIESTLLKERVSAGELPPIAKRIPAEPLVVDLVAKGRKPGVQGGTLRTMVSRSKDIRQMVVFGYARLAIYNEQYELTPDILSAIDVEADRIFTLHLRDGHRWSDGHPFTSSDFEYWWNDVANDPDLSPSGPPQFMLVDGEPPTVTFPDEVTVVYEWSKPCLLYTSDAADE